MSEFELLLLLCLLEKNDANCVGLKVQDTAEIIDNLTDSIWKNLW